MSLWRKWHKRGSEQKAQTGGVEFPSQRAVVEPKHSTTLKGPPRQRGAPENRLSQKLTSMFLAFGVRDRPAGREPEMLFW